MDGKPMLSEKERARFSVSNSPMQAMIILTPLLLSFVKHVFFVYAVATALTTTTATLLSDGCPQHQSACGILSTTQIPNIRVINPCLKS